MQGFLQTMYIQKKLNLEKKEQKSKLQCKEAKCSLLELHRILYHHSASLCEF